MRVFVYMADINEINDEKFNMIFPKLNKVRQEKISKMIRQKDKKLALAAGNLIRQGLTDYGLNYDRLQFGCNPYGKPIIIGEEENKVYFNISHSNEIVMCVVSDVPVGCDIEYTDGDNAQKEVAELVFSKEECTQLDNLESESEYITLFYQLWTRKESLLKAVGCGMSDSVAYDENNYQIKQWTYMEKYQCAYCAAPRGHVL